MFHVLLAADGDALLYDASTGDEDEQMKVHVRDGSLVEMSKTLPPERVSGENVGILRLSRETARSVAAEAASLIAAGHERAWLAEAINAVAAAHPITCVDIEGWPWVEIDFPDDLVRAREEVLPRVAAALAPLEADHQGLVDPVWRAS
jgi:choline kinase